MCSRVRSSVFWKLDNFKKTRHVETEVVVTEVTPFERVAHSVS